MNRPTMPVSTVPDAVGPTVSHRRPVRSRRRRLVAVLATVVALTGSLLALDAVPAAAAGEQEVIDQAKVDASVALLRPDCRRYLTGPSFQAPADRDPVGVLLTAAVVPGPVPANQPAGAFASSPLFDGAGSTITVHPNFFNPAEPLLVGGGAIFAPSERQKHTILVLHEVGHLTGREGDHNGDLGRNIEYNTTILNLCLANPPLADFYFPVEISLFTCAVSEPDFVLVPGTISRYVCDLFWVGGDPALVNAQIGGVQPNSFVDTEQRHARSIIDCPPPFDFSQGASFTMGVHGGITDFGAGSLDPDYTWRYLTTTTSVFCNFPPFILGPVW